MDELSTEQKRIVELLRQLPEDDDRVSVFNQFCTHCGWEDPGCQCWNDE